MLYSNPHNSGKFCGLKIVLYCRIFLYLDDSFSINVNFDQPFVSAILQVSAISMSAIAGLYCTHVFTHESENPLSPLYHKSFGQFIALEGQLLG